MLADLSLVFNSVIAVALRARLKCQGLVAREVAQNGAGLCELDTSSHFLCLVLEAPGSSLPQGSLSGASYSLLSEYRVGFYPNHIWRTEERFLNLGREHMNSDKKSFRSRRLRTKGQGS